MSLLTLMAQNERTIRELYLRYSSKFSEDSELWEKLAQDEEMHANWLTIQQNNLDQGLVSIDNKRFNESAIKTFTDYLKIEMDRLDAGEVSLINALSVSLYIEQSLIEHKYFEVLDSDSEELKNTLTKIKKDTEAHSKRIKEIWLKYS
ncbi:hypothetical protein ACFLYB_05550 [Chloroflexota bacterium]